MPTNLPLINPPYDNAVEMNVAVPDLFWYKIYTEHNSWTLWVDAIEDEDEWDADEYEIDASFNYSRYALEIEFVAEGTDSGVCLRNFSWTPRGGICLFRKSGSSSTITTYRLNTYEFE